MRSLHTKEEKNKFSFKKNKDNTNEERKNDPCPQKGCKNKLLCKMNIKGNDDSLERENDSCAKKGRRNKSSNWNIEVSEEDDEEWGNEPLPKKKRKKNNASDNIKVLAVRTETSGLGHALGGERSSEMFEPPSMLSQLKMRLARKETEGNDMNMIEETGRPDISVLDRSAGRLSECSFKTLREGDNILEPGAVVIWHYQAKLKANGQVFDEGEVMATLGSRETIFDQACGGIRLHEEREIFIPSHFGYGAKGLGKLIPPHADLEYTIAAKDTLPLHSGHRNRDNTR